MTGRLLLWGALALGLVLTGWAGDQEFSPAPSSATPKLAPFEQRLAAAKSVRVQTSILGVEIDSTLEAAHARLDPLSEPAKPPLREAEDGELGEKQQKVLWQLAKSDFSSVYVKTDDKERVIYVTGFLRPGKELPFEKIGQVEKAPMLTETAVAWDTVKPKRPLIRVVARGTNRRASSITIFVVKRPAKP